MLKLMMMMMMMMKVITVATNSSRWADVSVAKRMTVVMMMIDGFDLSLDTQLRFNLN